MYENSKTKKPEAVIDIVLFLTYFNGLLPTTDFTTSTEDNESIRVALKNIIIPCYIKLFGDDEYRQTRICKTEYPNEGAAIDSLREQTISRISKKLEDHKNILPITCVLKNEIASEATRMRQAFLECLLPKIDWQILQNNGHDSGRSSIDPADILFGALQLYCETGKPLVNVSILSLDG